MAALRRILRQAITSRALRDRGGVWAALAVLWYGARFVSRLAQRHDEVVHHQVLKPGETVTIAHTVSSRRDVARADKLAAKEAAAGAKAAKRAAKRVTHGSRHTSGS